MKWAWRYWKYLRTWRLHRETIKELNRLSDRELNDMGLSRGNIYSVAYGHEERW